MNHTHNRKKTIALALGAAAAAVAAPALLVVGAGTAYAGPPGVSVYSAPNLLGTNISVYANSSVDYGWCTYQAFPQSSVLLPTAPVPFKLEGQSNFTAQSATFFMPGVETGTQWNVAVNCPAVGGPQDITTQNPITY